MFIGTNSTGKGAEIGHSDDTGGEDDSFEPREGNIRMFGPVSNGAGRPSGIFRGESQNDPSRSNSLMSENSSQPDMHPFYKVRCTNIDLYEISQCCNLYQQHRPSFDILFFMCVCRKLQAVTLYCTITRHKTKMISPLKEANVLLYLTLTIRIGFGSHNLTAVTGLFQQVSFIL